MIDNKYIAVKFSKRKIEEEKIKTAKELTPTEWREIGLRANRILKNPIDTQVLEFVEWE